MTTRNGPFQLGVLRFYNKLHRSGGSYYGQFCVRICERGIADCRGERGVHFERGPYLEIQLPVFGNELSLTATETRQYFMVLFLSYFL